MKLSMPRSALTLRRLTQAALMATGAGQRNWRVDLSTSAVGTTQAAVHARDRIGKGPWYNAKGVLVAANVAQLHGDNNLTKASALDERGNLVKGRGDTPNEHDILTGSRPDGSAFSPTPNLTCNNWTSSGDGAAFIGHHEHNGVVTDPWALIWNSSHQTRGCGQDALKSTGWRRVAVLLCGGLKAVGGIPSALGSGTQTDRQSAAPNQCAHGATARPDTMAKTYAQIQTQIHKLQQEADALKAKEVAGVVARIQEAITHYGLTAQDLFGTDTKAARPQATRTRTTLARAERPAKAAKAGKTPAATKYQDDAGHQWSGIGKRPNWFKAALASGKTAADLLARKPAAT